MPIIKPATQLLRDLGLAETLLLDGPHAAAFAGVRPGVLRRWVREGLPFVRSGPGGQKYYTRRDLERFIERIKEKA